jgi:hypothetical protein
MVFILTSWYDAFRWEYDVLFLENIRGPIMRAERRDDKDDHTVG